MASEKLDKNEAVTMLEEVQLRKLAKLLLHQEETLMRRIKSEQERAKYLEQSNNAYDNMINLMDTCNNLVDKYENKEVNSKDKADIAKQIHEYIICAINMSMQCVQNCCLRGRFVEKVKTQFNTLANDVDKLDTQNAANLQHLAKNVSLYKACMWEYASKCRSGSARASSKDYSSSLKKEGIKLPELVERHKNKLGFKSEFQNLEEAQKLEVYNSIIEESGRAKIPKIEVASAKSGVGLLVIAAGLTVCDICTTAHDIESALSKGLSSMSEKDSFAVQVGVEEDITAVKAEVELGTIIVSLAGFVVGTIAGLIFTAESGALIEQILETGGKAALNLDGHKFHSEKMPDVMALAHETAHESQ